MTSDFLSRMVGLVVFLFLGVRLGLSSAGYVGLPPEYTAFIFGLVGVLFGLILTPIITVRPIRSLRRSINERPVELLFMSLIGMFLGLVLALLATYPLSLLPFPFGQYVPPVVMLVFAYLGLAIFGVRSREIMDALGQRFGKPSGRMAGLSTRKLILDTSVLIDGRIIDIAETGFIGGTLIVPRFVLSELHRVADSSDHLRRNRGRRGLNMLNKLQRNEVVPVRIVEDDFEEISAVDDKLVALAVQMTASIVTNDYNLNQVADAQGVPVLNINQLSNAVRSVYIPGETFALRIIQEGREHEQGVGYLEDGTMVVVEKGSRFMDRTITVEVTKLIQQPTGRMIFAVPEGERDVRSS
jgi:uncharacterized protein YacL